MKNTTYIKKPTQEGKILRLLRQQGKYGVPVYKMIAPEPYGLGIAQYNARIFGLREKGYVIENIKDSKGTRFVLTFDIDSDVAKTGQKPLIF